MVEDKEAAAEMEPAEGSARWRETVEQPFRRQDKNLGRRELVGLLLASMTILPVRLLSLLSILLLYYLVTLVWVWLLLPVLPAQQNQLRALRVLTRVTARSLLLCCGFWRVCIEGVEHRGREGEPRVFVSNHLSWIDALFFISEVSPAFVFKKGLLQVPVIGRLASEVMQGLSVDHAHPGRSRAKSGVREEGDRRASGSDGSGDGVSPIGVQQTALSPTASVPPPSSPPRGASEALLHRIHRMFDTNINENNTNNNSTNNNTTTTTAGTGTGTSRSHSHVGNTRGTNRDNPASPPFGSNALVVFPEGTTTNGKVLISFRTGVFVPARPVHPVLIEMPFRGFSPTWESMALPVHLIRLMCTWSNSLRARYLRPYTPSALERQNPRLYADNVRLLMSKELGVPTVESDYRCKLRYHSFLLRHYAKHPRGRMGALCTIVHPDELVIRQEGEEEEDGAGSSSGQQRAEKKKSI